MALDVVIVPDFAGPAAKLFEARTLLFPGQKYPRKGAYPDTLIGKSRRLLGLQGAPDEAPVSHEVERVCGCIGELHEKYVAPAFRSLPVSKRQLQTVVRIQIRDLG